MLTFSELHYKLCTVLPSMLALQTFSNLWCGNSKKLRGQWLWCGHRPWQCLCKPCPQSYNCSHCIILLHCALFPRVRYPTNLLSAYRIHGPSQLCRIMLHGSDSIHTACVHETSVYVYLLLPIPNLRGSHPFANSGKPNPSKRQSHLGV